MRGIDIAGSRSLPTLLVESDADKASVDRSATPDEPRSMVAEVLGEGSILVRCHRIPHATNLARDAGFSFSRH